MVRDYIRGKFSFRTRRWINDVLGRHKRHWSRVVMNEAMERFVQSLARSTLDVLEISGDNWGDPRHGFRSYRCARYPEYDVCRGPFEGNYDLIIAEQVFEHTKFPHRAAHNVLAMLRPGGVFAISTPFLVKLHSAPLDLYRWTELGIRTLLEEAGFSDVRTGSWGNRACVVRNLTPDDKWADYNPLFHSLKNDPYFPVVVWAFARNLSAVNRPAVK